MNNAQELKAHLQDSNKARIYAAKKKQDKWDKLETKIWRVVLFKEDKKANEEHKKKEDEMVKNWQEEIEINKGGK